MIEVLSSGALNLVQDLGRFGALDQGVSRSGAMDVPALALANALVGNVLSAAGIEVTFFPFRLRAQQDVTLACTGAICDIEVQGQRVPGWTRLQVQKGQEVVIAAPRLGVRAYLAFAGGVEVPQVMGSRSTDLKAGFGGFQGRGLQRADVLPLGAGAVPRGPALAIQPCERAAYWQALRSGCIEVRVIAAAETYAFSEAALTTFHSSPYRIGLQSNRVGYRLEGEHLNLEAPLELRSHGIVPGTVQVPPAGLPIVQMAEANTCGGYPKIANVIEADLWRLAQAPSGTQVRFVPVNIDDALVQSSTSQASLARLTGHLSQAIPAA